MANTVFGNSDKPRLRIFSEYGAGLGGGVFLIERAEGRKFDVMAAYGVDLYLEMFGYKGHQAIFETGYVRPIEKIEGGSAQVEVITSYHLLKVAAGYTARWLFFLSDIRLGLSMAIVSAETSLYDLGEPAVSATADRSGLVAYYFPNRTLVDRHESEGLSNGLLINVGFGVDAGELLMEKPRILEFRIIAAYVRRDERNEIFISYLWCFFPTGLW